MKKNILMKTLLASSVGVALALAAFSAQATTTLVGDYGFKLNIETNFTNQTGMTISGPYISSDNSSFYFTSGVVNNAKHDKGQFKIDAAGAGVSSALEKGMSFYYQYTSANQCQGKIYLDVSKKTSSDPLSVSVKTDGKAVGEGDAPTDCIATPTKMFFNDGKNISLTFDSTDKPHEKS